MSWLSRSSIAVLAILVIANAAHIDIIGCDGSPLPYNEDFGTTSLVYSSGIAEKIVEVIDKPIYMLKCINSSPSFNFI